MRLDKVVMYRDSRGEWRWRYVRSNGRVMADSGEGYRSKGACAKAARYVVYAVLVNWQTADDGSLVARVENR